MSGPHGVGASDDLARSNRSMRYDDPPGSAVATRPSALSVAGATVVRSGHRILSDVSVEFTAGRVTAIIGPNGAGKSTLLAVASGELVPESGSVLLGGVPLQSMSVRDAAQRRAVMAQDTTVAFPFTVREVVAMGRTAWSGRRRSGLSDEADATVPARSDREIVDATLHVTALTDLADREVTTLSGGERQRVAFARVVAQSTPVTADSVILLDEPTAAMDIAHAEATMRMLHTMTARGAAIGVVVHDLDAAAAYADRLVLLDRGIVRAAGGTADVCRTDLLSEVYRTRIDVFDRGGRRHVTPQR